MSTFNQVRRFFIDIKLNTWWSSTTRRDVTSFDKRSGLCSEHPHRKAAMSQASETWSIEIIVFHSSFCNRRLNVSMATAYWDDETSLLQQMLHSNRANFQIDNRVMKGEIVRIALSQSWSQRAHQNWLEIYLVHWCLLSTEYLRMCEMR